MFSNGKNPFAIGGGMKNQLKHRHICVMGYRSVGKSSLTIQYVKGEFAEAYDPTIENTYTKSVRVRNQDYWLKLVDTAGQDEYSIFPHQYTMDIHAFCLVYSINSRKSFQVVSVLYEKLMDLTGNARVPVYLVANKTDLNIEREVSTDEGRQLAASWKAQFIEITAKHTGSVIELFNDVIVTIDKVFDLDNPVDKSRCIIS